MVRTESTGRGSDGVPNCLGLGRCWSRHGGRSYHARQDARDIWAVRNGSTRDVGGGLYVGGPIGERSTTTETAHGDSRAAGAVPPPWF